MIEKGFHFMPVREERANALRKLTALFPNAGDGRQRKLESEPKRQTS